MGTAHLVGQQFAIKVYRLSTAIDFQNEPFSRAILVRHQKQMQPTYFREREEYKKADYGKHFIYRIHCLKIDNRSSDDQISTFAARTPENTTKNWTLSSGRIIL